MRDVLNQMKAANGAGLYYVALFSALAIPDICGALESQDGTANGQRYRAWFDRWVSPKYSFFGGTSLTGDVCYTIAARLYIRDVPAIPRCSTAESSLLSPIIMELSCITT